MAVTMTNTAPEYGSVLSGENLTVFHRDILPPFSVD